jgi:hypothetical protein
VTKTIGQRLDDPWDFFHWLDHAVFSLTVLKAALDARLFEQLGDEPITIAELAERCGLPADKLGRAVDFLTAEEVLALLPDGRVAATPRSRRIPEVASIVQIHAMSAGTVSALDHALRQGVSAFEAGYGKPVFEYFAEHPPQAAAFARFMGFFTRQVEQFVFTRHAFRPFSRAVDVGGSHGGLLLGLLAGHPEAQGVLFDLPETAAQVADAVRAAPHGERVEIVGGDFFKAVPAGDLYLLKMILHDWTDEECIAILRNIRAAIAPGGRIAVIEHVLAEVPTANPAQVMDIAMMVWAEGRERKLSEFKALFAAAGFAFDRLTENPNGQSVIEAVPV